MIDETDRFINLGDSTWARENEIVAICPSRCEGYKTVVCLKGKRNIHTPMEPSEICKQLGKG